MFPMVAFAEDCLESFLRHNTYCCHKYSNSLCGNVVVASTKVNQRRTRLVLGWVTVCRRVNHLGM